MQLPERDRQFPQNPVHWDKLNLLHPYIHPFIHSRSHKQAEDMTDPKTPKTSNGSVKKAPPSTGSKKQQSLLNFFGKPGGTTTLPVREDKPSKSDETPKPVNKKTTGILKESNPVPSSDPIEPPSSPTTRIATGAASECPIPVKRMANHRVAPKVTFSSPPASSARSVCVPRIQEASFAASNIIFLEGKGQLCRIKRRRE